MDEDEKECKHDWFLVCGLCLSTPPMELPHKAKCKYNAEVCQKCKAQRQIQAQEEKVVGLLLDQLSTTKTRLLVSQNINQVLKKQILLQIQDKGLAHPKVYDLWLDTMCEEIKQLVSAHKRVNFDNYYMCFLDAETQETWDKMTFSWRVYCVTALLARDYLPHLALLNPELGTTQELVLRVNDKFLELVTSMKAKLQDYPSKRIIGVLCLCT